MNRPDHFQSILNENKKNTRRFGLLFFLFFCFNGLLSLGVLVFIGWVILRLLNHFGVN